MKDISIIIPLHVFNDNVKQYLTEALKSVDKNKTTYSYGQLKIVIVATKGISNSVKNFVNSDVIILVNDGNTDFCSQINFAVEHIDTDYFSILEYDDQYKENWFKNAHKYHYGNESISVFLPLNVQHTNHTDWRFGNEFGLSNAFITDDMDDTDDIGIINFKRVEKCSVFNLTGAVFNRNDFIKVGKYKPSIKVAFNYEFLLRLTNKGLKCMVVPKEGYIHEVGRDGSLTDTYNKSLTNDEINKWFELAFREYVYDVDRKKDIITVEDEELK